jgi:hypothetical protein
MERRYAPTIKTTLGRNRHSGSRRLQNVPGTRRQGWAGHNTSVIMARRRKLWPVDAIYQCAGKLASAISVCISSSVTRSLGCDLKSGVRKVASLMCPEGTR